MGTRANVGELFSFFTHATAPHFFFCLVKSAHFSFRSGNLGPNLSPQFRSPLLTPTMDNSPFLRRMDIDSRPGQLSVESGIAVTRQASVILPPLTFDQLSLSSRDAALASPLVTPVIHMAPSPSSTPSPAHAAPAPARSFFTSAPSAPATAPATADPLTSSSFPKMMDTDSSEAQVFLPSVTESQDSRLEAFFLMEDDAVSMRTYKHQGSAFTFSPWS
eukprot:m.65990 g.65990  ORF g.65990 m.65990 type:complete len:218 (+) comp12638_c0_seq2:272-925(+)